MVLNPCQNREASLMMAAAAPMQVDGVHFANGADQGQHAPATVAASASNASAPHPRAGELTISFEGEVYVFPAVTPEKVLFFLFSF